MQYLVISARVRNENRERTVIKCNDLYPSLDIVQTYADTGDKELFKRMYIDELESTRRDDSRYNPTEGAIYGYLIKPVLKNWNVCIMYDETESVYIDVLVEYVKDNFSLSCINLDQLFEEGHVGPLYIDRDEIHDRAVRICRSIAREEKLILETSEGGREKLLKNMNQRERRQKLKEIGIDPSGLSNKEVVSLLLDGWVADE